MGNCCMGCCNIQSILVQLSQISSQISLISTDVEPTNQDLANLLASLRDGKAGMPIPYRGGSMSKTTCNQILAKVSDTTTTDAMQEQLDEIQINALDDDDKQDIIDTVNTCCATLSTKIDSILSTLPQCICKYKKDDDDTVSVASANISSKQKSS